MNIEDPSLKGGDCLHPNLEGVSNPLQNAELRNPGLNAGVSPNLMKIGYLGAGSWGFALASLLSAKGHEVVCWTIFPDLAKLLNEKKSHPMLPGSLCQGNIHFTTNIEEVLRETNILIESVTSAGIRPVFTNIKKIDVPSCPIVITSKGIEQNTGLILSDVIVDIMGENTRSRIGAVSGPSYATEVVLGMPTSVVGSAYNEELMLLICETFTTRT